MTSGEVTGGGRGGEGRGEREPGKQFASSQEQIAIKGSGESNTAAEIQSAREQELTSVEGCRG